MSVTIDEQYVRDHFRLLCTHDVPAFYACISPTVHWRIMGSMDLSGDYYSLDEYMSTAFRPVSARLEGHMMLTLTHCLVSGRRAAVEMEVDVDSVKQKNGQPLPNTHCWICEYDDNGVIGSIRMYIDELLMQQVITNNPGP